MEIDYMKIKFLDEMHVKPKNVRCSQIIGPIGERVKLIDKTPLNNTSYSVTLITTLNPKATIPLSYVFREGSNSGVDFLNALEAFVKDKIFEKGDYLFLDNAKVHFTEEILDDLIRIRNEQQINIIFLPTYSPELNPCELIFSFVKEGIRYFRNSSNLKEELMKYLNKISYSQMAKYYNHCIDLNRISAF